MKVSLAPWLLVPATFLVALMLTPCFYERSQARQLASSEARLRAAHAGATYLGAEAGRFGDWGKLPAPSFRQDLQAGIRRAMGLDSRLDSVQNRQYTGTHAYLSVSHSFEQNGVYCSHELVWSPRRWRLIGDEGWNSCPKSGHP